MNEEQTHPSNTTRTISNKQLNANRENTRRSTGPKSPEGKSRSSANALKHGLCAQRTLLPGENAHDWAVFHHQFLLDLQPNDALERLMVDRIAIAAWRLQRATRYEVGLIEKAIANVEHAAKRIRRFADQYNRPHVLKSDDGEAVGARAVGDCLASRSFSALARYESHIERGMFKAINKFQQLAAARQGAPATWAPDRAPTGYRPYPTGAQEPFAESAKRSHLAENWAQHDLLNEVTNVPHAGSMPTAADSTGSGPAVVAPTAPPRRSHRPPGPKPGQ